MQAILRSEGVYSAEKDAAELVAALNALLAESPGLKVVVTDTGFLLLYKLVSTRQTQKNPDNEAQ